MKDFFNLLKNSEGATLTILNDYNDVEGVHHYNLNTNPKFGLVLERNGISFPLRKLEDLKSLLKLFQGDVILSLWKGNLDLGILIL